MSNKMGRVKGAVCMFIVLHSLFLASHIMDCECKRRIAFGGNASATKLDFGPRADEYHQLETKSGLVIPMNRDTVFKGSIVVMNGNKMVRCSPIFGMSNANTTIIRMTFECVDESPTIKKTFWLELGNAEAKALCIFVFIYTIILWKYTFNTAHSYRIDADVIGPEGMGIRKATIKLLAFDFLKR